CVEDNLPAVRQMKRRSGDEPNENYKNGATKYPGAAKQDRRTLRERPERVADSAKKIALLLAFLCFSGMSFVHHVTWLFARRCEIARTDGLAPDAQRIDFR